MEKSLELSNISLMPASLNNGYTGNYDFSVSEPKEQKKFLPIFTRPIQSIITTGNCGMWESVGIRPIIPINEGLPGRLAICCNYFTVFTLKEIKDNFISNPFKGRGIPKIYIDHINGHDVEILNTCQKLKSLYGDNIIIMAGPIGNPKTYVEYCKAGVDFVRVGISIGKLDDPKKYGFYYPIASLLLDIKSLLKTTVGYKQARIIVDGGISDYSDITKCIALGADYVIIGYEFSKIIESSGPICKKVVATIDNYEKVENITSLPKDVFMKNKFFREYVPGEWVKVNQSIKDWLTGMYDNFNYAFMMGCAKNWSDFKKNINFTAVE